MLVRNPSDKSEIINLAHIRRIYITQRNYYGHDKPIKFTVLEWADIEAENYEIEGDHMKFFNNYLAATP